MIKYRVEFTLSDSQGEWTHGSTVNNMEDLAVTLSRHRKAYGDKYPIRIIKIQDHQRTIIEGDDIRKIFGFC